MSNVSILRWQGGAGGDTLLSMILGSNADICSNVVWDSSTADGATRVTGVVNDEIFKHLPHLVDIAMDSKHASVSVDQLINSIAQLKLLSKKFVLKSHWYKSSTFNDITIDLVTSSEMLPFVVSASVAKNSEYMPNYHLIRSRVKDPAVLKFYDYYSISWDRLYHEHGYSPNQVPMEILLGGWAGLCDHMRSFDLRLDPDYGAYYDAWLEKNQQYLPSETYKQLVRDGNFDYNNSSLAMVERYCLLALSQNKFTILH